MGKLCSVSRNHTWNSEFRSFRRYCYTVGYACVAGLGREVMSPSCRPCRDIPGVHCRQCDFDLMASSTDVVGLRDPVLSPAASVLQRGPLTKRAKEVYCNTTSTVMFFSEYTYNLNPHVCVNRGSFMSFSEHPQRFTQCLAVEQCLAQFAEASGA